MRTTISIPDSLVEEARHLAGELSFSAFASEAIRWRVEQLKHEQLAREMEISYRAEAECSSLDPEWSAVETEGL